MLVFVGKNKMFTNAFIFNLINQPRASGLLGIVARGYGVGRIIGLFGHPKRKILVMGFQGIFLLFKSFDAI